MTSLSPSTPLDSSLEKNSSRRSFWTLIERCVQLGAAIDVLLFFLFHWLGSPILAWVNILSISIYLCAYLLLRRRRNTLAVALIWFEVLAHSTLGIIMLGWESGLYYYMLPFIPLTIASTTSGRAFASVTALWAYFLGLYLLTQFWLEPIQPISAQATVVLHAVIITVVFAMLIYLAYLQIRAVSIAQRRLKTLATTDSLTGLFNRRYAIEVANYEILRRTRTPGPLALLIADLDHFKTVNDLHGHEGGDQVLKTVAQVLRKCVRSQDTVARWGGEEFLILLPDSNLQQAQEVAQRIRADVQALALQINGVPVQVGLTLGVSLHRDGERLEECLDRADRALYAGKNSGRNRVETE
ncbi:GGDEF domain-containing protein [Pseudomonas borbori]